MQRPPPDYLFTSTRVPPELTNLYLSGMKLGLENINALMKHFFHPEKNMSFVHVAGTNGKGSTSAMISEILMTAGLKTGLFTSPHLRDFAERFQINRRNISRRSLQKWVKIVLRSIKKEHIPATFFEAVAAICFNYFFYKNVDAAVIEVGMGGRFDATNIIRPDVSVITNIEIDHTEYLGRSLSGIAYEKGGILKKGVPAVIGTRRKKIQRFFKKILHGHKSRGFFIDDDFRGTLNPDGSMTFRNADMYIDNINCALAGEHQIYNAACAVQASYLFLKKHGMKLTPSLARQALGKVRWPARFQVISDDPCVVVDCAHNMDGIRALKKSLKYYYPDKKIVFLLGFLKDKRFRDMCKLIRFNDARYILSPLKHKRTLHPMNSKNIFDGIFSHPYYAGSISEGISLYKKEMADTDNILCVAGSLFSAAEAIIDISESQSPGYSDNIKMLT